MIQGKMMGIEKDGIIIKTKDGKKTYGIATGLNVDIPMLSFIEATIINMVVVQIQKAQQEPAPSTSGKLNSCCCQVKNVICKIVYVICHIVLIKKNHIIRNIHIRIFIDRCNRI